MLSTILLIAPTKWVTAWNSQPGTRRAAPNSFANTAAMSMIGVLAIQALTRGSDAADCAVK
jgi:hypothetical protein